MTSRRRSPSHRAPPHDPCATYNLGSGVETRLRGARRALLAALGRESPAVHRPRGSGQPPELARDIGSSSRAGFTPTRGWRDGVVAYAPWARSESRGTEVRICLRRLSGPEWQGGGIYVQNLARATRSPRERHEVTSTSTWRSGGRREIARVLSEAGASVFVPAAFERVFRGLGEGRERLPVPAGWYESPAIRFHLSGARGPAMPYAGRPGSPDFQFVHLPELFPADERARRRAETDRMAGWLPPWWSAAGWPQRTSGRLSGLGRAPSAPASPVMTERSSSSDAARRSRTLRGPRTFFSVCNQFFAHKDHEVVVEPVRDRETLRDDARCRVHRADEDPRDPGFFPR